MKIVEKAAKNKWKAAEKLIIFSIKNFSNMEWKFKFYAGFNFYLAGFLKISVEVLINF